MAHKPTTVSASRDGHPTPEPPPQMKWRKNSTKAKTWAWLWSQPLASAWQSSDSLAIARYVELMVDIGDQSMGAGVTVKSPYRLMSAYLSELRALEDRLGLTAKARQTLGIIVTEPESAPSVSDEVSARRKRRRERAVINADASTSAGS